MIKDIELNAPQTPVLALNSFHSVNKRFYNVVGRPHFDDFLEDIFIELSIKNLWLNDQLKEIYLINEQEMQQRGGSEFYSFNKAHHQQILLTDFVCNTIALNAEQLYYAIYRMKYAQTSNMQAPVIELKQAVLWVQSHSQLKDKLLPFATFVVDAQQVLTYQSYKKRQIPYNPMLLTAEPVFFAMQENEPIQHKNLRVFVEQYGLFFICSLNLLYDHSPKVLAMQLERWLQST